MFCIFERYETYRRILFFSLRLDSKATVLFISIDLVQIPHTTFINQSNNNKMVRQIIWCIFNIVEELLSRYVLKSIKIKEE